MKLKKTLLTGLAIVGAETILFVLLVYGGKPEPSISIGLIIILPFIFVLNIILGLLFYFYKFKRIATLGFINSAVAPFIFYFIWSSWYSVYASRNYSQYSFNLRTEKFQILLSKDDNYFSIADITNRHNGTTTSLYYGNYQLKGDTILMVSTDHKIFILDAKLYNFPMDSSAIDLHNP